MRHPYASKITGTGYLSKLIEVEVEGELKNGVPNGQCFIFFTNKVELESKNKNISGASSVSSPFSHEQYLTFRGAGVFLDGVLSGGPALSLLVMGL
jgi:hypothetical protein